MPSEEVTEPTSELREVTEFPNITIMRSKMPASRWFDGAYVDKERRRLVQDLLAGPLGLRFRNPVQWFYDPMAVTAFAGHMGEQAIVFDCMDQLSQFKGARMAVQKAGVAAGGSRSCTASNGRDCKARRFSAASWRPSKRACEWDTCDRS